MLSDTMDLVEQPFPGTGTVYARRAGHAGRDNSQRMVAPVQPGAQ